MVTFPARIWVPMVSTATEILKNSFGTTEGRMQSPLCSISRTNITVLCTVFPILAEIEIQHLVYWPQLITIYCVLILDNHKMECYTLGVIDFCAHPVWDMNGFVHSWYPFHIAHVVKFVRMCQWHYCAQSGLPLTFLYRYSTCGRKECNGADPSHWLCES